MKRLDVGNGRTISFPPMHTHGAGFAQFNGDDSRRRVRAEEQRVFLKFNGCNGSLRGFRVFESELPLTSILSLAGRGGRVAAGEGRTAAEK